MNVGTARIPGRRRWTVAALALWAAGGQVGAATRAASPAAIRAQLDAALDAQLQRCWTGSDGPADGYLPRIVVRFDRDGRVAGEPALVDLPLSPEQVSAAAFAIAAVRRCDPIRIPPDARRLDPAGWRRRLFRFDPEMGFVMVIPIGSDPADTKPRDRLPPAVRSRLDALLEGQIQGCYDYSGEPVDYVPELIAFYDRDGRMSGEPLLVNLPVGPEQVRLAASAIEALRACDPLRIPQDLVRYYDEGWRRRVVRFDTLVQQDSAPPAKHTDTLSSLRHLDRVRGGSTGEPRARRRP